MSIAAVKKAFNEAAAPYAANFCLMDTRQHDGTEWNILTFRGNGSDGNEFEIVSEPIPPGGSVIDVARATAVKLKDQKHED